MSSDPQIFQERKNRLIKKVQRKRKMALQESKREKTEHVFHFYLIRFTFYLVSIAFNNL